MDEAASAKDASTLQAEISRLSESLLAQERTVETLRAQNSRLTERLLSSQTYSEELRLQVERLNAGFCSRSAMSQAGRDRQDRACQTSEGEARERQNASPATKWSLPASSKSSGDEAGGGEDVSASIVEQVRQTAEAVAREQFLESMVFEKSSGLYYDYKSGYYYDAQRSLYYDGNSGTYYNYNYESKEYEVHSHSQVPTRKKTAAVKGETKKAKESKVVSEEAQDNQDNLEEGEVDSSSDESSMSEDDSSKSNFADEDLDGDDRRDVGRPPSPAPALRIIVKESESDRIGTLFIVTCMGGTVGREGEHDVTLADVGCSKYHAKISFESERYHLTDLGSRNGTYINSKRVSVSKVESDPLQIGHGTVLQIGTTKLVCHVHPGKETCFECEPGLTMKEDAATSQTKKIESKTKVEKQRKKEIKMLRQKYGLSSGGGGGGGDGDSTLAENQQYVDRAGKRRKQVGSDNPHEKTEYAHMEKSIAANNKGFKMLAKMGWKEGDGLGKGEQGRVEPVGVEVRADRAGLGLEGATLPQLDAKAKAKAEVWRKTQERFGKIVE